jgi:creatinine amidohydrolase
MSFYFRDQSWVHIQEHLDRRSLLILPVGTTEEHGPHLPVESDTMIGEGFGRVIGEELARRNEIPFLVMRTVVYGYSMGCVQDFPGTISVRPNIVEEYVFDIVDSLCRMGFSKVVILGCHGNHDGILRNVMRRIVDKYGVYIGVVSPLGMSDYKKLKKDPDGDIHAGESETSLIWALQPHTVKPEMFDKIDHINLDHSLLGPVSTWGLQDTQMGSFGDPTYASKELGEKILETGAKAVADWSIRYYNFFKNKPNTPPKYKTL